MAPVIQRGTPLNPIRLDLFQTVRNVNWPAAGPDILALEFSYSRADTPPAITLHDLHFTGATFDLFATEIINRTGAGDPPSNPFTPNMLRFLRMWNRPPVATVTEHVALGTALLFFNIGLIRQTLAPGASRYDFKISTPANGSHDNHFTAYWVWSDTFGASSLEDNEAHPFTVGDPVHGGIIIIPAAFATSAEADEEAAALTAGGINSFVQPRDEVSHVGDNLAWNLRASSYRKKLDFPSDVDVHPTWDVEGEAISFGSGASGSNPPARTILVSVALPSLIVELELL